MEGWGCEGLTKTNQLYCRFTDQARNSEATRGELNMCLDFASLTSFPKRSETEWRSWRTATIKNCVVSLGVRGTGMEWSRSAGKAVESRGSWFSTALPSASASAVLADGHHCALAVGAKLSKAGGRLTVFAFCKSDRVSEASYNFAKH